MTFSSHFGIVRWKFRQLLFYSPIKPNPSFVCLSLNFLRKKKFCSVTKKLTSASNSNKLFSLRHASWKLEVTWASQVGRFTSDGAKKKNTNKFVVLGRRRKFVRSFVRLLHIVNVLSFLCRRSKSICQTRAIYLKRLFYIFKVDWLFSQVFSLEATDFFIDIFGGNYDTMWESSHTKKENDERTMRA